VKGLFSIFKRGLQRTATRLVRSVQSLFTGNRPWAEEDYEQLEAALIGADLGVTVTQRLMKDIRDRYNLGEIKTAEDILKIARADIISIMSRPVPPIRWASSGPTVILMIGVNGSGKTTTTGKMAHLYHADGKTVMLAACDTFRAAATEQLKIWGERTKSPVISGKHGADAAAVAFDAATAATARSVDLLVVDTAGRQHNKRGLMDELAKVKRILGKAMPGAPHETWLVLDGSTGSNALVQAREFSKGVEVTGLVLTKLDGSYKGGIAVAIQEELAIPVRFVGLGEAAEDLQPFDPENFAQALFEVST
jgi:fused signal recognition particle receptor